MTKLTKEQVQAIKLENRYWSSVLEEATRDEILYIAKRMDISTHHESGRQRALKQLKGIIAYNKEHEFRKYITTETDFFLGERKLTK